MKINGISNISHLLPTSSPQTVVQPFNVSQSSALDQQIQQQQQQQRRQQLPATTSMSSSSTPSPPLHDSSPSPLAMSKPVSQSSIRPPPFSIVPVVIGKALEEVSATPTVTTPCSPYPSQQGMQINA